MAPIHYFRLNRDGETVAISIYGKPRDIQQTVERMEDEGIEVEEVDHVEYLRIREKTNARIHARS